MRTKGCLDEAAIQAYADGELAPEAHSSAARHLAECDACAAALDEAQAELSFFAAAFAPAAELSVPTERLRASIDDALAALNPPRVETSSASAWSVGTLFSRLAASFSLTPRYAGAFAGLAALAALALLFGLVFMNRPGREMADANAPSAEQTAAVESGEPEESDATKKEKAGGETTKGGEQPQPEGDAAPQPAPKVRQNVQPKRHSAPRPLRDVLTERDGQVAEARTTTERTVPVTDGVVAATRFVPGEETYVRAVASLKKMIDLGGDRALRPSVRADYERNLAVVNRAIEDTRRAALRNPKDQDAAAYLFSSYQTKIDIMRSVAEQAQVATLGH